MLRKKKSPFWATFSQGYEKKKKKKHIYIYINIMRGKNDATTYPDKPVS